MWCKGLGACAPRAGLARRKGGQMAAKVAGGLRGGFVPPFVRKAVNCSDSHDDKAENPLSAKAMELLSGQSHLDVSPQKD